MRAGQKEWTAAAKDKAKLCLTFKTERKKIKKDTERIRDAAFNNWF